jgi:hypothetical protein
MRCKNASYSSKYLAGWNREFPGFDNGSEAVPLLSTFAATPNTESEKRFPKPGIEG